MLRWCLVVGYWQKDVCDTSLPIAYCLFPQTNPRRYSFHQSEHKIEVADGIEAPNPPFEDDPEHQDDAAGEDSPLRERVLLEEQIRCYELGDAVQDKQSEPRRDEIPEKDISNNGSPPHETPVGSIHIITAPPTAPMPTKRVNIFSSLIIVQAEFYLKNFQVSECPSR